MGLNAFCQQGTLVSPQHQSLPHALLPLAPLVRRDPHPCWMLRMVFQVIYVHGMETYIYSKSFTKLNNIEHIEPTVCDMARPKHQYKEYHQPWWGSHQTNNSWLGSLQNSPANVLKESTFIDDRTVQMKIMLQSLGLAGNSWSVHTFQVVQVICSSDVHQMFISYYKKLITLQCYYKSLQNITIFQTLMNRIDWTDLSWNLKKETCLVSC